MRILIKVFLLCASLCILAQSQGQTDDVAPYPPDFVLVNTLGETLGYGVNYYTLIPIKSEPVKLRIENLGQYDSAVLVMGVDIYGEPDDSFTVRISKEGTATIEEEALEHFDHVYLISLQSFHVQSDKPLSVMGIKTRNFTTVAPTRHLEMVKQVEGAGKTRMVGVTPDGKAYYPVFGYLVGRYDQETKTLYSEDGRVLDILK